MNGTWASRPRSLGQGRESRGRGEEPTLLCPGSQGAETLGAGPQPKRWRELYSLGWGQGHLGASVAMNRLPGVDAGAAPSARCWPRLCVRRTRSRCGNRRLSWSSQAPRGEPALSGALGHPNESAPAATLLPAARPGAPFAARSSLSLKGTASWPFPVLLRRRHELRCPRLVTRV